MDGDIKSDEGAAEVEVYMLHVGSVFIGDYQTPIARDLATVRSIVRLSMWNWPASMIAGECNVALLLAGLRHVVSCGRARAGLEWCVATDGGAVRAAG